MIIEAKNKIIIFIHPPRSGGTSIEHSLLNGAIVPDNQKHLNANQIKNFLGEDKWNNAFKFGIIRNPWERMSSLYITNEPPMSHYNNNAGKSMSNFLTNYQVLPWEHGMQCSDYLNEDLDYIIRFEDRENDIERINGILSEYGLHIDSSVKKRQHKNKNSNFMSYFDEDSNKIMNEKFSDDIAKWYGSVLR